MAVDSEKRGPSRELADEIIQMNPAIKRTHLYELIARELGISAQHVLRCVNDYGGCPPGTVKEVDVIAVLERLRDEVKADVFACGDKICIKSGPFKKFLQCFGKLKPVCRHLGLTYSQYTQVFNHPTLALTVSQWEKVELLWEKGSRRDFTLD